MPDQAGVKAEVGNGVAFRDRCGHLSLLVKVHQRRGGLNEPVRPA